MPLTANSEVPVHNVLGDLLAYKCGASVVIYKGGFVGLDPAGYAKPFVPGDRFAGVAYEEVTAATATTTAGTALVRVYHRGFFKWTSATAIVLQSDAGRPVYATDDGTLALAGHPDAFVGQVTYIVNTTEFRVKLRNQGQRAEAGDGDCLPIDIRWDARTSPTLVTALTTANILKLFGDTAAVNIVGATSPTVNITSSAGGEVVHTLNNAAEVETVAIETQRCFNSSMGITFEMVGRQGVVSGAATFIDFGLIGGLNITAAMRASVIAAGTALQKHALFHIVGNSLNIFAASDDNAAANTGVDTTIDNILAGPDKYFKIIVRPSGVCEFWTAPIISAGTDRAGYPGVIARVLGGLPLVGVATAFTVGAVGALDTSNFAGYIGISKTAEAGVGTLNWKRARMAGCSI